MHGKNCLSPWQRQRYVIHLPSNVIYVSINFAKCEHVFEQISGKLIMSNIYTHFGNLLPNRFKERFDAKTPRMKSLVNINYTHVMYIYLIGLTKLSRRNLLST